MPPPFTPSKKGVTVAHPSPSFQPRIFLDIENQNYLALQTIESDFASSCCTCTFVSVLPVHFQVSCSWWNTEVPGDFAFSNNYGTTVHDERLELIFFLPSYTKCNAVAKMNPLFL